MSVLDSLLEGFNSAAHPRDWHGRFRIGDVVRVLAGKRGDPKTEVVGRIQRFTASDTAIVAPEHGGAHIEAKPDQISFHDPHSHRQLLKRMSGLDPQKPHEQTWAEGRSDRAAIDQAATRRAEAIGQKPNAPRSAEPTPAVRREAQQAARAGQGAGPAIHSSGKLITDPQRKRLSKVIADIHANAWQDRAYMDVLVSRALRDSGHTQGTTPGWMDKLHTNHASQLIKDLERLAKHGPGEDAKPFAARESAITVLLEAFAPATPAHSSSSAGYRTSQSQQFGKIGVQSWSAAKHPRGGGGKFGYTTGGKRATRSSPGSGRYLATGSKGALIKSIQRQLHVAQDGQFGPQTRAAVVRFQQQHGLAVDGVVGQQTLAALRGKGNAKAIAPGPIGSRAATVHRHPAARTKRKPAPAFPATGQFGGGTRV